MSKNTSKAINAILTWMVGKEVSDGTAICRSAVNMAICTQIGVWVSGWKLSQTTAGLYHNWLGWGVAIGHVLVWVFVVVAVLAYPVFAVIDRRAAQKVTVAQKAQDARVAAYHAKEAANASARQAEATARKAAELVARATRATQAFAAEAAAKASVTTEQLDRVRASVLSGGLTEYGAATTLQRDHSDLSFAVALDLVRGRVTVR